MCHDSRAQAMIISSSWRKVITFAIFTSSVLYRGNCFWKERTPFAFVAKYYRNRIFCFYLRLPVILSMHCTTVALLHFHRVSYNFCPHFVHYWKRLVYDLNNLTTYLFFFLFISESTSASAAKSIAWKERRTARWSSFAAASQTGEAYCGSAAWHCATSTGN